MTLLFQNFLKRHSLEHMITQHSLRIRADTKNKMEKLLLLFEIIKTKDYSIDNGGLGVCSFTPTQAVIEVLNLEQLEKDEQEIVNSFNYRYDREPRTRLDKLKIEHNAKLTSNSDMIAIRLPGSDYTVARFGKQLGNAFKGTELIFYREKENEIVEIREHYDELVRKKLTAFKKVDATRLLNIIEQVVSTYYLSDGTAKNKSPNEQQIKLIMKNTDFLESIYKVDRFLQYPMPFMINGTLEIPQKGYNQKFQAYLTEDAPELYDMPVEQAKEILLDILHEFCFESEVDRTIAISYLITPACRGIYKSITDRSPIYLITANRERAGKDYLAGVQGILYEGRAMDDPAIITGGREQNNEELRKKLTSALKMGRRRYHSANNKGRIDSAILEGFVTSKIWQDRELGGNVMLELNNEMDMSLSANSGITYSPDFWHRCRKINLFFSEEDPNKRIFERPDLQGYVLENRETILSAIYSLIKAWIDAGSPSDCVFSSFPEWARVVGGIMNYHNLGDPCQKLEDDAVGGDKETQDMKELYSNMWEYQNARVNAGGNTPSEIMNLLESMREEWGLFGYYDFTQTKDRTKFSLMLRKWLGRELGGITLKVNDPNQRANRQKFSFVRTEKTAGIGNVATFGNHRIPTNIIQKIKEVYRPIGTSLPKPTTLPTLNEIKDTIKEYLYTEKYTNREMIEIFCPGEVVDQLLHEGWLMEVKPGVITLTEGGGNPDVQRA